MIEIFAVPQKDCYEHKCSLYCMVDVDNRGNCVECIISSAQGIIWKKLCVCVIYHIYSIKLDFSKPTLKGQWCGAPHYIKLWHGCNLFLGIFAFTFIVSPY